MFSILPINSLPNRTFTSTLTIDGQNRTFTFFFWWNTEDEHWNFSIYDVNEKKTLLACVPVRQVNYPYGNLLYQYKYLKIGSLFLINNSGSEELPTSDNFGTEFSLYWGDTNEQAVS